jgi:hypothetical protein
LVINSERIGIYVYDTKSNELINHILPSEEILNDLIALPLTDDFVALCNNTDIFYIQLKADKLERNFNESDGIKLWKSQVPWFGIEKNYILFYHKNPQKEYLVVCDAQTRSELPRIFQKQFLQCFITPNGKYLVGETIQKEVFVFRLKDNKKIASVQMKKNENIICVIDEYVTIYSEYDLSIYTFHLIDYEDQLN